MSPGTTTTDGGQSALAAETGGSMESNALGTVDLVNKSFKPKAPNTTDSQVAVPFISFDEQEIPGPATSIDSLGITPLAGNQRPQ
jgi:hypothetical protein